MYFLNRTFVVSLIVVWLFFLVSFTLLAYFTSSLTLTFFLTNIVVTSFSAIVCAIGENTKRKFRYFFERKQSFEEALKQFKGYFNEELTRLKKKVQEYYPEKEELLDTIKRTDETNLDQLLNNYPELWERSSTRHNLSQLRTLRGLIQGHEPEFNRLTLKCNEISRSFVKKLFLPEKYA